MEQTVTQKELTEHFPYSEAMQSEAVLESVRSLFNNITPTTQKALTEEFLKYNVSSNSETLSSVIDIIFDKAVEEPNFGSLYAEICMAMVKMEKGSVNEKSPFREAILKRSKNIFTLLRKTHEEEREVTMKAIRAETDEMKQYQMMIELEEQDVKFRRNQFGNIIFTGHLSCEGLLSDFAIVWGFYDLLRATDKPPLPMNHYPEEVEEAISCAVKMLEAIGKRRDPKHDENVAGYLSQFDEIKDNVSDRNRLMILNLFELRKNNWLL